MLGESGKSLTNVLGAVRELGFPHLVVFTAGSTNMALILQGSAFIASLGPVGWLTALFSMDLLIASAVYAYVQETRGSSRRRGGSARRSRRPRDPS